MTRKSILYVEQNKDGTVGGSHYSLLDTIRYLDRNRFSPRVLFYRKHSLFDEFQALCPTFVMPPRDCVAFASKLPRRLGPLGTVLRHMQKGINLFRCVLPSLIERLCFLRAHRVDLVHLNNAVNRGYYWVVACRIVGVKCITHNRGLCRLSALDRFFARRFDAVVSIAEFLRYDLEGQGAVRPERSFVIYNGFDPEGIVSLLNRSPAELRRDLGLVPGDPLIGVVGNIREWKGQDVVVRAVHLLRERYPTLRCLVIGEISDTRSGDRSYLRSIERYIDEHGLWSNVLFLGFRDDVPDLVKGLDVLVHASISPEPFGRVILEGMMLGRPVVATNFGGPVEIIEDGVSGLLVPPGDERALSEAIDALLADGPMRERIARAGMSRAMEHFHINRYIEEVHDLYERLLPERV